jgi:hypothetical protein
MRNASFGYLWKFFLIFLYFSFELACIIIKKDFIVIVPYMYTVCFEHVHLYRTLCFLKKFHNLQEVAAMFHVAVG